MKWGWRVILGFGVKLSKIGDIGWAFCENLFPGYEILFQRFTKETISPF